MNPLHWVWWISWGVHIVGYWRPSVRTAAITSVRRDIAMIPDKQLTDENLKACLRGLRWCPPSIRRTVEAEWLLRISSNVVPWPDKR